MEFVSAQRNVSRSDQGRAPRFGVRIDAPLTATGRDVAVLARAVEQAGLDSFWLLDNPRPVAGYLDLLARRQADSLTACAWAAAVTRRITVGPAAIVGGLRRPELFAGQCETLASLSTGRLVVGLAVGWHREDFKAFGLSYEDRGPLADTALRALRGGDVPVPVWLAGGPGAGGRDSGWSGSWLRRAQRCDGWLARPQADAAVIREGLERLALRGLNQEFEVAHVNYTSLCSGVDARLRLLRRQVGEDQWATGRDRYWIGDDDEICERVLAMVDAGVSHVIAHVVACDVDQVERWANCVGRIRTVAQSRRRPSPEGASVGD